MSSWVPVATGSGFPITNLPYGVFSRRDGPDRRIGVGIGDFVLDILGVATATRFELSHLLDAPVLNGLMAAGPAAWSTVRTALTSWLSDPDLRPQVEPNLVHLSAVELHLPFEVGDYVDFYSSEHHAVNAGRILRPGTEPLFSQWKHLPIGYHGRSGTVVVSGAPVARPCGQRKAFPADDPTFGPSERLDIEAEVGFVVGTPSNIGEPIDVADFNAHVFGVCLLNDWSARDIQAWEYVPLGPFLGKSFLTSISPWIVPITALEHARVRPPRRDPQPLHYLLDGEHPWGLDITMEVRLNGDLISRPPFSTMYWTPAQQLAHMTSNGASVRTGDLYASGTVSGPDRDQWGSLMELSWGGAEPFVTPDGTTHSYLADGDEVVITASAPGAEGTTIGFGEVRGKVVPNPRFSG